MRPEVAPLHWRQGIWQPRAGSLTAAEESFQKAKELAPRDPSGELGLARVALQRGERGLLPCRRGARIRSRVARSGAARSKQEGRGSARSDRHPARSQALLQPPGRRLALRKSATRCGCVEHTQTVVAWSRRCETVLRTLCRSVATRQHESDADQSARLDSPVVSKNSAEPESGQF